MTSTAPSRDHAPVGRRPRARSALLVLLSLPTALFLVLQIGTMFNDVSAECTCVEARAGNQVCLAMTDGAVIVTVAHGLHFSQRHLPPAYDVSWEASWSNNSSTIWLPRIDRSARTARFSETFIAIPAWLLALVSITPLGALWVARRRAAHRRRHGRCTACGYNTLGLKSAICPECGAPTSESVADGVFSG